MPKYYCDYCDTYLTHDSVSDMRTTNRESVILNLNISTRSQLERLIVLEENIKKMSEIITRNGWKNKLNV